MLSSVSADGLQPEPEELRLPVANGDQEAVPGQESAIVLRALRGGVVPTSDTMSLLLEQVEQVDDMERLHAFAATWEKATRELHDAFEKAAEIAEFRVRLERKLGLKFLQNDHRGGHGSKSRNTTSNRGGSSEGLPENVGKHKASWYRKVAMVPEEEFDAYLAQQKEKLKLPSANGVINFALARARKGGKLGKTGSAKRSTKVVAAGSETVDLPGVPDDVIDAVKRLLTVDVLVGGNHKAFPNALKVAADLLQSKKLRGDVFVAECPDPAAWLPKLAAARADATVAQVVVVVQAATGSDWFSLVEEGKWVCWFPRGSATAVLYAGGKRYGFGASCHGLGAVLYAGDAR